MDQQHTTANEAPPIRQLSTSELKALIEGGAPIELVDVRTDEKRAFARIDGSRLLMRHITMRCSTWIGKR